MKKIVSLITILAILVFTVFTGNVYALETLDEFAVSVDKEIVHPGENVVLTVNFGKELGTFTVKVDFDNDVFEYVSTEGGTGSAEEDTVTVTYTESSTTLTNIKITFKAKEELKTSNPTEFSVTASNLASQNSETTYEDISSGKVETVTAEPIYEDYILSLEHTGDIIAGQETDFVLSYSSSMGRPYAKARLEGTATTVPESGTVKLIGTEQETSTQYDIIDDGWGDPQGYEIGGENVSQKLNLKGTFSKAGEYVITLKLINRESSDATIVEKAFNFNVKEAEGTSEPEKPSPETPSNEQLPEELPKTGYDIYVPIAIVFIVATIAFVYISEKRTNV